MQIDEDESFVKTPIKCAKNLDKKRVLVYNDYK